MIKKVIVTFLIFFSSAAAFAAHPMITDDTGTQGKGKMQLEFIGEYGKDREDGVAEKGYEIPTIPVFSYGLNESVDLVFGVSYLTVQSEEEGISSAVRGIGDAAIEVKARLYEKEGFSFAVKPGVSFPTGSERKGLGNGKVSYSAFLIATREADAMAFHFNAGYVRNEYKLEADEEANNRDIWHVSLASQVEVVKNLDFVANIGMERNPDKTSNTNPAFALGGFIYTIRENLDIDLGIKAGLNKPETDYSMLAGLTWRL